MLGTLFQFQSTLRAKDRPRSSSISQKSPTSILRGSAPWWSLRDAQQRRPSLALVGVNERVRNALIVTRVEPFFRFFPSLADAEHA